MAAIERMESNARMSQIVVHGGVVYLAGQVAENTGPDVYEQTRAVLAEIDRLLVKAGTSKARLLTATIYLTDMSTFGEMNRAWQEWVDASNPPTRATVATPALAAPQYKVEIVVSAACAA